MDTSASATPSFGLPVWNDHLHVLARAEKREYSHSSGKFHKKSVPFPLRISKCAGRACTNRSRRLLLVIPTTQALETRSNGAGEMCSSEKQWDQMRGDQVRDCALRLEPLGEVTNLRRGVT